MQRVKRVPSMKYLRVSSCISLSPCSPPPLVASWLLSSLALQGDDPNQVLDYLLGGMNGSMQASKSRPKDKKEHAGDGRDERERVTVSMADGSSRYHHVGKYGAVAPPATRAVMPGVLTSLRGL